MTLAQLPIAYAAARDAALAEARAPGAGAGICRYCGKRWNPLPRTKLDGHARCVVTPAFREALDDLWRSSPDLTRQSLAYLLGVSVSTIIAWTAPRTVELGARWESRGGGA